MVGEKRVRCSGLTGRIGDIGGGGGAPKTHTFLGLERLPGGRGGRGGGGGGGGGSRFLST